MLRQLLVIVLRWFAPEVDAANVAIAEEMGLDTFTNMEDEERECVDTPLELQHYRCKERMRWALLTISNRESAGNWSPRRRYTGIHKGDSHHAPRVRRWAYKFGRLSWWCPAHWGSEGMSTVGPHGLMYGYNVQHLGVFGNCVPTWAFGIGSVSARAAGVIYIESCGYGERSWCPTLEQVMRTKKRAKRKGYS